MTIERLNCLLSQTYFKNSFLKDELKEKNWFALSSPDVNTIGVCLDSYIREAETTEVYVLLDFCNLEKAPKKELDELIYNNCNVIIS